jgi:LuxR family maltose regulon positive regulatory protein
MQRLSTVPDHYAQPPVAPMLNDRDLEVLRHLAGGMSTAGIAAAMSISGNTVRTRIRRLLGKFAVIRRDQAVRRARALGII